MHGVGIVGQRRKQKAFWRIAKTARRNPTNGIGLWRGTETTSSIAHGGRIENRAVLRGLFHYTWASRARSVIGGGTTAVASLVIGRHWLGFEINPTPAERRTRQRYLRRRHR